MSTGPHATSQAGGSPDTGLMNAHPCLTYRDIGAAIEWLHAAFAIPGHALTPEGGVPDAPVNHGLLRVGDGTILVESERPDELHGAHAGNGWVYVTVTDADVHYQRAKAAGAHVHGEPHDFGQGHRGYSVDDLEGNLWTFGTAKP